MKKSFQILLLVLSIILMLGSSGCVMYEHKDETPGNKHSLRWGAGLLPFVAGDDCAPRYRHNYDAVGGALIIDGGPRYGPGLYSVPPQGYYPRNNVYTTPPGVSYSPRNCQPAPCYPGNGVTTTPPRVDCPQPRRW